MAPIIKVPYLLLRSYNFELIPKTHFRQRFVEKTMLIYSGLGNFVKVNLQIHKRVIILFFN